MIDFINYIINGFLQGQIYALLALGLPGEDETAWHTRQNAQYALNEGRTPWLCEKCSDPDCEHRLFTGLLQRGD